MAQPHCTHHLCLQGTRKEPPPSSARFWSCRTFSSGLGEHLALCPPACRTALPAVKERGQESVRGGRVGLGQYCPACRGQPGPDHAAKTAPRELTLGSYQSLNLAGEPRDKGPPPPNRVSRIDIKDTTLNSRNWKRL